MKSGRRLLSMLLVLAMLLGMSIPVVSAETVDEATAPAVEETQPAETEPAVEETQAAETEPAAEETQAAETEPAVEETEAAQEVSETESAQLNNEVTIVSFSVEPVTLTEGVNMSWIVKDGDTRVFVYNVLSENPMVTVNFSDETTVVGPVREVQEQLGIYISPGNLAATEDWTVGKYTHEVSISGYGLSATVDVTIVEDYIDRIEAGKVTYFEGNYSGYFEDGRGCYDVGGMCDITVYYKDGQVSRYDWWEAIEQIGEIIYVDYLYNTCDWTVGEYTFLTQLGGRWMEIPVEILPNPVANVTVEPVVAYEGIHQHWDTIWDEEAQKQVDMLVYRPWDLDIRVNVTYTDGRKETCTLHALQEQGISVAYPAVELATDWEVGKTYEVPLKVSGKDCVAQVTVKENPVASVEASPLEIKFSQRTTIYMWDEETQQEITYEGYEVASNMMFKVTLKDGTIIGADAYALWDNNCEFIVYDNQGPDNLWLPGNTYKVEYYTLGYSGELEVTIIDDGIKQMSITPRYPLYETLSGYESNLWGTDPVFTIEYNNGEKITFDQDTMWEYVNWGVELYLAEESEDGALTAGEHKVKAVIDGEEGEFTVKVLENPVESFTVTTKYPFVKNVHGYMYEDYFYYEYYMIPYTVVLNLKDGTTETYTSSYELWEKYRAEDGYPHMIYEAGDIPGAGTYLVDVSLMNMVCEQSVTVVDSEIKSVSGYYEGTLVENIDGDYMYGMIGDGDVVSYFHYIINWDNLRFVVTYADGSTRTLRAYEDFMGTWVSNILELDENQDFDKPWKVGMNTMYATLLGHEFEINVEVVKNTIEDVKVKANKPLYQGWDAWFAEGRQYLNPIYADLEITITYTDGSSKTYGYRELSNQYPYIDVYYVDGTTVGQKTSALSFGAEEYKFTVEVKENPVEKVAVEPSQKLMHPDQEPEDTIPIYSVTFKDGSLVRYHGDDQIFEEYGFFPRWDTSSVKVGEYGKQTAQVEVFGYKVEFEYEVAKPANPVVKLTAKAIDVIYADSDPYHQDYDYSGLVELGLHYADGTVRYVMANDLRDSKGISLVSFEDDQYASGWGVGTHKATVYYLDLEAEVTIEVVANPYVSVAISGTDTLKVTLKKADGSQEVRTAYDFKPLDFVAEGAAGYLYTDKGAMFVQILFKEGSKSNIECLQYQGMRSADLDGCKWLSKQLTVVAADGVPDISIDKTSEELLKLVSSEALHAWLAASLQDLEDGKKVVQAIDLDELAGYDAGLVVEMQLMQLCPNYYNSVSKTPEAITITMAVPQAMIDAGMKSFKILRICNGEPKVLETSYDPNTQTVTFSSDQFYIFILAGSKGETKDGWIYENGKWYYYENGKKVTNNWVKDSKGWCYLGADGAMVTNEWVKDSVGWCYVGADGYCVTDEWVADSWGWCYLDSNGRMATNRWIMDSVGWCYVGADGYCVTDKWVADSYGWCYLDHNGRMVTNKWVKDSVGWCYVGADGYCVTNCWKQDSVGWCYLDKDGRMVVSNWIEYQGEWYYLDANGYMVTGRQVIGGKVYYFDDNGVWIG